MSNVVDMFYNIRKNEFLTDNEFNNASIQHQRYRGRRLGMRDLFGSLW